MRVLRRFRPPVVQSSLCPYEGAALNVGCGLVGGTADSQADEVVPCRLCEKATVHGLHEVFEFEKGDYLVLNVLDREGFEGLQKPFIAADHLPALVGSFVTATGSGDDLVGKVPRGFTGVYVVNGEVGQSDVVIDRRSPFPYRPTLDDYRAKAWMECPDGGDGCVGVASLGADHELAKEMVVAVANGRDGVVEGRVPATHCPDVRCELSGSGGAEGRPASVGVWGHVATVNAGRHGSLPVSLPGWPATCTFAASQVDA